MNTPEQQPQPIEHWSVHPDFPADSRFYRSVLDAMPGPLLVVDEAGLIVYANEALMRLAGRSKEQGIQTSIFEYIHPDDVSGLAEAFAVLASPEGVQVTTDRPWAPVYFRMVHGSGRSIPVAVTGRNRIDSPEVKGVIYDVRPAIEREIFQRVLAGAHGQSPSTFLELVIDLIVASTLEIEAAVIVHDRSGVVDILSTSEERLEATLRQGQHVGELDWTMAESSTPTFHASEAISGSVGRSIRQLGYQDAWTISVASPMPNLHYTILAFTPVRHIPAIGVTDLLTRAADLAAVVLLRSRTEELLNHAVHHDDLTGLVNRAGMRRRIEEVGPTTRPVSVLFIDLDGFKAVNDAHGHAAGDRVLQRVAERLKRTTRPSDIVVRVGGDEFAILLLAESEQGRAALAVGERIVEDLEDAIEVGDVRVSVSASVGIVDLEPGDDIFDAVDNADRAMYIAKRAGGRRIHEAS